MLIIKIMEINITEKMDIIIEKDSIILEDKNKEMIVEIISKEIEIKMLIQKEDLLKIEIR
jgi:hypothetical protein